MARASISDPAKTFRFRVRVDNFLRAGFSEVSGISRTTDVVEYREGGDNETPQKSAGLTKYDNVTLRRGLILGDPNTAGYVDFVNWASQVHTLTTLGTAVIYRRTVCVDQYSVANKRVMTCTMREAWITVYKPLSDMNGNQSDNSIEEIQIAHEGYEQTYT